MKKLISCLFFLLVFLSLNFQPVFTGFSGEAYAAPPGPAFNADARVSMFYDALLPYGNWIYHEKYGWCWYPYNVPVDWRPYSDGRWEYTDDDWTWVSDYPWGWACFHYGRWFYDDAYGWLWWPDTVWAPAWVVWRTGDDWIGWAPCPPEAFWNWNTGLGFAYIGYGDFFPYRSFCFVKRRHFHDHDLRHRIEMAARNASIINQTTLDTKNLKSVNHHIVNSLPVQQQLEKELGHAVKRLRITQATDPVQSKVVGNEVRFYRPELRGAATGARPERRAGSGAGVRPERRPEVVIPGVKPERRPETRQTVRPEQRPVERPAVSGKAVPPEILNRQKSEMQRLDQYHNMQRSRLKEEHNQEIKSPPAGVPPVQLQQRHQVENKAYQEQMRRETRILQNVHSNEQRMITAPSAPPPQRFEIPTTGGGADGAGRVGSGDGRGVGGGRGGGDGKGRGR